MMVENVVDVLAHLIFWVTSDNQSSQLEIRLDLDEPLRVVGLDQF